MLSKRRLTAIIIVLAMVLSLAACGNNNEGKDETATTSTETGEFTLANLQPSQIAQDSNYVVPKFETNDETITAIEINQSLSYGKNSEDGSYYLMEAFVSGRETAFFVTFSEIKSIVADGTMLLSVERNGEFLADLVPINAGSDAQVASFQPKNMSDVNNWEEGGYSFAFKMGDSEAVRESNFYKPRTVKVLAVPVLGNYSGEVVSCEGEWQTSADLLYATYPIGRDTFEYILGNEIDLSDDIYDLNTDDGQYNVWEALCNLQTPNKDYELIVGFVRDNPGNGSLAGFTFGHTANIVTESDGDMQATVPHEIAHCYDIGDEYQGGSINLAINPPPYGMEGSDWDSRDMTVAGNKSSVIGGEDVGLSASGSVVDEYQRPFYTAGQLHLEGVTSYMGTGSSDSWDYWTTSDIWNHLFKAYVGKMDSSDFSGPSSAPVFADTESTDMESETYNVETEEESGNYWGVCQNCYEDLISPDLYWECEYCYDIWQITGDEESFVCESCGEEAELKSDVIYVDCSSCEQLTWYPMLTEKETDTGMSAKTTGKVYAIDIKGTINKNGSFTKTPWYTYESDSSSIKASKKGEYGVYLYDSSGKQVSMSLFDVSFSMNTNPPKQLDFAPIDITVRFPDNTSKIVIKKADDEVFSVDVSANAPEIAFVEITENQKFEGKQTIKWEASDKDSDSIFYELWYCPSEDEFINLASNISEPKYEVDFSTLPGTTEGYFYVYATDGVLTTGIDSPWIEVSYKAPDIISKQESIPEYKITDEIVLDADIYDMQDGWLFDEGVSWILNGREFMSGSTLWIWPYELAPGEHKFTLNTVNSGGVQSQKEFTFKIVDDESALPDDWSKEDVKNALTNGFVAPLASVKSPITRGQYSSLMSLMYMFTMEEDTVLPVYKDGVVTDCGNDDYDQYLMVALGVMEAEDGKFNPNGQLTQKEAAVIMYNLLEIADPSIVDHYEDVADIIEVYTDNSVIDESGPNGYNADEKITGQLALVRCYRLYEAIFGQ